MFTIGDLKFDIQAAVLDAFIDEDDYSVNWGLEITGRKRELFGGYWQPSAYSEVLFKTAPYEVQSWKEIAGRVISWDECYDEEQEGYHAALYTFEHEGIYDSRLEIIALLDGSLGVKWRAKCDVFWNEQYSGDLDLVIETPICFKGVLLGNRSQEEAHAMFAKAFDPRGFSFTTTDSGVSLFVPVQK